MITNEQFNNICNYVREQFKEKDEFSIYHSDFEKMFDLKPPYYREMIDLAEKNKIEFEFNSPCKYLHSHEPADKITFYKQKLP